MAELCAAKSPRVGYKWNGAPITCSVPSGPPQHPSQMCGKKGALHQTALSNTDIVHFAWTSETTSLRLSGLGVTYVLQETGPVLMNVLQGLIQLADPARTPA